MQANYFVRCPICGSVADVKYQFGFSKRHPIRFNVNVEYQYWENINRIKEFLFIMPIFYLKM